MRLTDCSFNYLGEHGNFIDPIKKGGLVSNEAQDGDTAVSLLFWDDGFSDVENPETHKVTKVQDRTPRFRIYDGITEATIKRHEDGTLTVTGYSSTVRGHPAFTADEETVTVKVVPGPNCVNCGHD